MNKNAWSSASKDGLILALPALADYALTSFFSLPTFLAPIIWVTKTFLTVYLLIRLASRYGREESTFTYSNAFVYSLKVCCFSSILCTVFFVLNIFVIKPELIGDFASTIIISMESQGYSGANLDYDSLMKVLPTSFTIVYFLYLMFCGLVFSSLTALRSKKNDNPFQPTEQA